MTKEISDFINTLGFVVHVSLIVVGLFKFFIVGDFVEGAILITAASIFHITGIISKFIGGANVEISVGETAETKTNKKII